MTTQYLKLIQLVNVIESYLTLSECLLFSSESEVNNGVGLVHHPSACLSGAIPQKCLVRISSFLDEHQV